MMQKKYELIEETLYGLYRIRALRDFGNVKAGDLGGWIKSEKNLSHEGTCWVSGGARVFGNALVSGGARVFGEALVSGGARVFGEALVSGGARVFDRAWVSGEARVFGEARVSGGAQVTRTPLFLSGLTYPVTITDHHIQIGCLQLTAEEFTLFTEENARDKDGDRAVEFYRAVWPFLASAMKIHGVTESV
jgi:carbonic anhydrase/acetyltransferase-like protein (isoleucine patch superfamily)